MATEKKTVKDLAFDYMWTSMMGKLADCLQIGNLLGDISFTYTIKAKANVEQYPNSIGLHMQLALSYLNQGFPDLAKETLEKARKLEPEDPKEKNLLPSEDEWNNNLKITTPIVEEVPGTIWRIPTYYYISAVNKFLYPGNGHLVKLQDNTNLLINPVELSEEAQTKINQLGGIQHVLSQNPFHHRFFENVQKAYPQAKLYGVPLHGVRAETKNIPFAGFMSDDQKPLFPDFEQITLEGHAQGEVWLLHKQSKSLFTTDTITHHFPTDIWFQRMYAFALNCEGPGVGCQAYQPKMILDKEKFKNSVERLLKLDFDKAFNAHGKGILQDAKTGVVKALKFLI